MSYILDALKKADQKRKLGMIPGLQTDQVVLVNLEKKQRFSPLLIALVTVGLLLNGALLLWWARPWQTAIEVVAPVAQSQPVVARARESASPPALPGPDTPPHLVENPGMPLNAGASVAPVVVAVAPEPVAPLVAAPEEGMADEEGEAPILSYPEEPVVETVPPGEAGGGAEEAVAAGPAGDQGAKVVAQAELPDHIQAALPQLRISLHFFSNKPGARLVRINDRHLHEGEMVASDLRLLEITESGVVLSFRGHQFLVEKL